MLIDTLTPPVKSIILDMDGVLWRGSVPLVDLPALFARMRSLDLMVVLATNNATRDPDAVIAQLAKFGVTIAPEQVVTSGMVVTYLLKQRFPDGGPIYVVGEPGLVNALAEGGFYPSEDGALAVVAGLDRGFTYDKLRKATVLIRGGVPFYGTNPDTTFPTPDGLVPGAGSVLAAIQAATSVAPILAGKPQPGMFLLSMQHLGTRPDESLVIGDRLDTDIAGGQAAGCRTALVLSGVTTMEQAEAWNPKPDLIVDRVDELF